MTVHNPEIQENQMVFYQDGVLTAPTPGIGKPMTIRVPFACTIIEVLAHVETAPLVQAIIIDVNKNGISIWNLTPGNRVQIAAGATVGNQTLFDTNALAKDDELTIDSDQVGVGTPGSDLTLYVRIRRS